MKYGSSDRKKIAYEEWKKNRDLEEKRKKNREKYPELAKFFDELQKYFPGAKVVKITPLSQASHESDVSDDEVDQK